MGVLAVAFGVQFSLPSPASCAVSLQNSGLEADSNRDGVPDYWQRAGYGTNTATWARTTVAHSGSFAQQVTVKNWVSGDRKLLSRFDSSAPVALPA
ncbi:MAG TPA: galactose oxidase, partial [Candidatus Binatia bacterium]|nr:galactose oxidase [Candidatus Binatia bacterium]